MATLELLLQKDDKETLVDCVVYLLQHCTTFERTTEKQFCLDVAKKALFLYNLSPNSFGDTKKTRKEWLSAIKKRIEKYKQPGYHTENSINAL